MNHENIEESVMLVVELSSIRSISPSEVVYQ